jgi:hypothetical protein
VEASEIIFRDYQKVGNYQVPRRWTLRQLGEDQTRYTLQAEFNPPVTDDSFRYSPAGYVQVKPVPTTLEENVDKLADGVYVIQNVTGQNQNSDGRRVRRLRRRRRGARYERRRDALIKRIHELIPGKPIRYVAMTHHHGDHIGGMRSFIAEGATVFTTAGEQAGDRGDGGVEAERSPRREPRKPEFLLLENGRRTIEDGKRRLELIDIGPNPHAKADGHRLAPGRESRVPGRPLLRARQRRALRAAAAGDRVLRKKLRELNLPVEKIAAVHGATATAAQFREATATVTDAAARFPRRAPMP